MGMSAGKRGKRRGMSEINVTPLVDVMLVLLIIFMVTAPMLTATVDVNLPDAGSGSSNTVEKPVVISVQQSGKIFVGEAETELDVLADKLTEASNGNNKAVIQLRGDKDVDYGRLMAVMDSIRKAGFTKIALLTDA